MLHKVTKRGNWRTLSLCLLLLTGCSGPAGLSFFGLPRHPLIEETRAVRQPVPPAVPRELDKKLMPAYAVEPGDVLLVYPVELDSPVRLPGDQPILPDGTINLGKYGRVVVAGHTIEEIEDMVRGVVEAQTKDAGFIAVRLVSRQSKVYYVIGEVNAPGAYQLSGRETVLDGIVTAGGLTDRASRKNIVLSRPTAPDGCRVVLPVCIREIVQLGDTTTNYQLAAGDRIFVPSACFLEDWWDHKDCFSCGGPQTRCEMPAALGLPKAAPEAEALPMPAPVPGR
jgi:protein involved in polysaccharide export with SLBB domain